jgi:putative flippase GtrA
MTQLQKSSTVMQAEKFGLVGILNTLIDYILFIGLTVIFSIPREEVYKAKFISGAVAMANSFYFNRIWVFKSKKGASKQAVRFLVSTVVAVFIIQAGTTQLLTNDFPQLGEFFYQVAAWMGIPALADSIRPSTFTEDFVVKTVAFAAATVGSMTWNFLLYKYWAFKE